MKRLLLAAALTVAALPSIAAETVNLSEICELQSRGFVAAAPCMSRLVREMANDTKGEMRNIKLTFAARIDVIAERRRAGEIDEGQAARLWKQAMETHNARNDAAYDAYVREARAMQWRRSMSQGLNDLSINLQMQQMLSPTCTRYGFC